MYANLHTLNIRRRLRLASLQDLEEWGQWGRLTADNEADVRRYARVRARTIDLLYRKGYLGEGEDWRLHVLGDPLAA